MAKPPDMGEMMGALGGMPKASDEPAAPPMAEPEGTGEVSDEEMSHAQDMLTAFKSGDAAGAASALKRFVKACTEGGYEEEAPPASQVEGDL